MLAIGKSIAINPPNFLAADVLEFRNLSMCVYEKLEKKFDRSFRDRPSSLLIRPAATQSENSGMLCHVIVVQVEQHMLPL